MDHRSRAHRARFERYQKLAVNQPVISEDLRSRPHRHHLRVRRRIRVTQHSILSPRNNLAAHCGDRPNRNLAGIASGARLFQRSPHQVLVAHDI
jgi:hypothetical protein